jgi:hypothetical protein
MKICIKNLLIVFVSAFTFSCAEAPKKEKALQEGKSKWVQVHKDLNDTAAIRIKLGEVLFSYDEVVHYKFDRDSLKGAFPGNGYSPGKFRNEEDSLLHGVYWERKPLYIDDSLFVSRLRGWGYKERKLDTRKFLSLLDLIKVKLFKKTSEISCQPLFNDILVLKRKSKIVLIIKLCLSCVQIHYITPKEYKAQYFDHNKTDIKKESVFNLLQTM